MEEPNPKPPPTQIPNPLSNQVKTPPHLQSNTNKKRPFENDDALNSNASRSFKIRALLNDIRPNVLEVLRTPDFQKCKAANKIQEKVKLLMELYKQMASKEFSAPRSNNEPDGQLSSGVPAKNELSSGVPAKNELPSGVSGQKLRAEDGGACIVGGSVFGWNFITSSSTEPVFYGRTKESFRAQAVKLTTE